MLKFLLFCWGYVTIVISEDCPSGVKYTNQPPPSLPCKPAPGDFIRLRCEVSGISVHEQIKWYRSLGQDQNDSVEIINSNPLYSVTGSPLGMNSSVRFLSFTVADSTYGFYWCAVVGLIPTASFTPICPQQYLNDSSALAACSGPGNRQYYIELEQCADIYNTSELFSPNITSECVLPPINTATTATATIYSSTLLQSYVPTNSPSQILSADRVASSDTVISSSTITTLNEYATIIDSLSSPSLEPSQAIEPKEKENDPAPSVLLVVLIIVCVLLGCVALMIVIAISMLCYLTKRGSSKDDEGSRKPPTVDPIRYDEFYTEISNPNDQSHLPAHLHQNGKMDGSPSEHDEQASSISFSNPVYEVSNPVQMPPSTLAPQSSLPEPHPTLVPSPPALEPQSSSLVPPPKQLPTVFSPTPPIFGNDDDAGKKSQRSYYAKPDLSKKRSRSATSQEKDTTPPFYMNNQITNRSAVDEVVYDSPVLQQPLNKLDNQQQPPTQSSVGVEKQAIPSEYSTAVGYEDPSLINANPGGPMSLNVAASESSYDDPWETLPCAIKRSRESTRSRSYRPTSGNGAIPASNANNNNTSSLFDDPAYDIPTCDIH